MSLILKLPERATSREIVRDVVGRVSPMTN